jgi:antitoxin VapB
MNKVRITKSGRSQIVRLPKEFQFRCKEVEILRRGDEIILRDPKCSMRRAFKALTSMPPDFMEDGRNDTPPQERESLEDWVRSFDKKR